MREHRDEDVFRFAIAQQEARRALGMDKPHRGQGPRMVGNQEIKTANDAESMLALAQKRTGP